MVRKPETIIDNIKVLMYHRIVDDEQLAKKYWNCVHVNEFKSHLKIIDKLGFTTITLHDYWLSLVGELTMPRKPVVITFDDGYEDISELVLPLIQEYGMRAVVFVLGDRLIDANYWDSNAGLPGATLMNNRQLWELHESGIEIGSHSMTHTMLTNVLPEEAKMQILDSKISLEDLLGDTIDSFSYPYGLLDENIREFVIRAGYKFGCGVYSGPPLFGADLYDIRRITVRNDTNAMGLTTRLLLPFEYYEWSRWRLRNAFSEHEMQILPDGKHVTAQHESAA